LFDNYLFFNKIIMLFYWIFFIVFGLLIIFFPSLAAYIVASIFILMWINILVVFFLIKIKKGSGIIIWDYKVMKK